MAIHGKHNMLLTNVKLKHINVKLWFNNKINKHTKRKIRYTRGPTYYNLLVLSKYKSLLDIECIINDWLKKHNATLADWMSAVEVEYIYSADVVAVDGETIEKRAMEIVVCSNFNNITDTWKPIQDSVFTDGMYELQSESQLYKHIPYRIDVSKTNISFIRSDFKNRYIKA